MREREGEEKRGERSERGKRERKEKGGIERERGEPELN